MIKFKCLYCEVYYEVPDELAGGKARCDSCSNYFIVPPYSGESVVRALPYEERGEAGTVAPQPEKQKKEASGSSFYSHLYEDGIPIKQPRSATGQRREPPAACNPPGKAHTPVKRKRRPPQKHRVPIQKKRGNYSFIVIFLLILGVGGGLAYKFISPPGGRMPSASSHVLLTDENSKAGSEETERVKMKKEIHNTANLLPVERHGQLHIEGNKLIDSHGNPIALNGMSMFHCGDGFKFRNYECMKWLRDDWKCNILRIAITPEIYRKEQAEQDRNISEFIDNCVKLGIYVILDFHGGGPPMPELKTAKAMFSKFSRKYANIPNIIYEPFNEPFGRRGRPPLSWSKDIKPYHEEVIRVIRKNDPDNIIILGTPSFSLSINKIIDDPVKIDRNIMYVAHFYAASHKHGNRKWVVETLNAGYPVFISEFGTCEYTGNGKLDFDSTAQWIKLLDKYQVSWCNWSVHDKDETASILKWGSSSTGHWKKSDLRDSGKLIRRYLRGEIDLNSIQMETY